MKRTCSAALLAAACLLALTPAARAVGEPLAVAVFEFEARDDAVKEPARKVGTLLNAYLSAEPNVMTVERTELQKILGEQELALGGAVSSASAAKVGQLTGAQVLVTGSLFTVDQQLMLVGKIISTETGRVFGEIVKGPGAAAIDTLSAELAKKIGQLLAKQGAVMVAKVTTHEERVAQLKAVLKDRPRPVVRVKIAEQHYGGQTIDPAAETEFGLLLKETGFTLVDPGKAAVSAELELVGEAFSEFGLRKGNLYSCKARVEIKVVEPATGKLLWVDRQTSVAMDVAERTAGKTALQNAAARLAERVLPKLVK